MLQFRHYTKRSTSSTLVRYFQSSLSQQDLGNAKYFSEGGAKVMVCVQRCPSAFKPAHGKVWTPWKDVFFPQGRNERHFSHWCGIGIPCGAMSGCAHTYLNIPPASPLSVFFIRCTMDVCRETAGEHVSMSPMKEGILWFSMIIRCAKSMRNDESKAGINALPVSANRWSKLYLNKEWCVSMSGQRQSVTHDVNTFFRPAADSVWATTAPQTRRKQVTSFGASTSRIASVNTLSKNCDKDDVNSCTKILIRNVLLFQQCCTHPRWKTSPHDVCHRGWSQTLALEIFQVCIRITQLRNAGYDAERKLQF